MLSQMQRDPTSGSLQSLHGLMHLAFSWESMARVLPFGMVKNSWHSALVKPLQHGQVTEKGLGLSIFPVPAPRSQLGLNKHQEKWKRTPGGCEAAAEQ